MCENGIISADEPFKLSAPQQFPGDDKLKNRLLFAPFWANIDTRRDGKIWYHFHLKADNVTQMADAIVHNISSKHSEFVSSIVAIATWENVPNYPDESSTYSDHLSGLRNTFQTVIISDGTNTFVLYIYIDINWSGRWGFSAVGGYTTGDGIEHFNVPGSGTEAMADIDQLRNTNFTGLWFSHVIRTPKKTDMADFNCRQWYCEDRQRFGIPPAWLIIDLPHCPSSLSQASLDNWFTSTSHSSRGFCFSQLNPYYMVVHGYFLSAEVECCYNEEGWLNPLGSASPYHQFVRQHQPLRYLYTDQPYDWCCVQTDLCLLYRSRRPSVSSSGYRPPFWGQCLFH